jgi:hypothetical protein
MLEFLTADGNQPFTVALAVMLIIAVIEGVTSLLGAGLSELIDALLPDMDLDVDVDLDAAEGVASGNSLSRLLGWLRIGQVPVLILLVVFLTAFGLIGLGIQSFSQGALGFLFPGWIASIPALFLSLPVVRVLGGGLAKIMPKDETDAVSEASFVGRVAVITLGNARRGYPAEARLKDEHGQLHYVMVEPDSDAEELEQGTTVLLVKQESSVFRAIRNTSDALID